MLNLCKNPTTIKDLKILKEKIEADIENLRMHGKFPKENNHYDYKAELNIGILDDPTEIFMMNLSKDIISFSNADGGIVFLGIVEDVTSPSGYNDLGLNNQNLNLLARLDLNLINQKFNKIAKVGVSIDLQEFQSGTRKFYYILIAKQNQVIVPINDFLNYGLRRGEIIYRSSGLNQLANSSSS